jgi:hypothetical protein
MDYFDGVRGQVSLLLSEGHRFAQHYPLAMVGAEAAIARRRINGKLVTESTLMQACIGAVMNGKKGGAHYRKLIKDLNRG